jgi:hypothetical protein
MDSEERETYSQIISQKFKSGYFSKSMDLLNQYSLIVL